MYDTLGYRASIYIGTDISIKREREGTASEFAS